MELWEALTADPGPSATLRCWVRDRFEEARWSDVVRDAEEMTAGLRRAGVTSGSRVAAILVNSPQTVRGLLAVWLAGGSVASLPTPARGMTAEEYAKQLRAICGQLDPVAFMVDAELEPAIAEQVGDAAVVRSWDSVSGSGRVEPSPPGDDELAFIQYSSGSTSTPKGCMLTTGAIAAQVDLLEDLVRPRRGAEVGLSWMPLSHDMGMFGGLLACWSYGSPFVLSTPERFMFAPSTWLSDAAEFGATITGGPDIALRLAARAIRPHRLSGPLVLRVCIIGAERVRAETLAYASERLEPFGFRPEVLMPAYGLAEATVAVTGTPRDEAPRHLTVDAIALGDGEVEEVPEDHPSATRIVSAGPPCKDTELPGASADRVEEILVRSPSLAVGYLGQPELTMERFRDDGLHTGDLGFVRDGHLYPVGRLDDLVSVGGRNVYTREIESEVDGLESVREGCTAIVQRDEGGALALLAELKRPVEDPRRLADEAASIALAKAGVAIDECVFLPKGSIPKTPSGKVQRHRCRHLLDAGRLDPLAIVDFSAV